MRGKSGFSNIDDARTGKRSEQLRSAAVVISASRPEGSAAFPPIPLIERVNRLVSPELKGFALARVTGGPDNRELEEIKNVREYQLTLRNTSPIHLQNVE